MASLILKPKRLRSILLRVLSFAAIFLAVKHTLFLSLAGDESLCIFPDKTHIFFGCLSAQSPPSILLRRGHREAVDYYSSVFQDLISQGFLSPESRSLCVGTLIPADPALAAMKAIGVISAVHGGDGNRILFESDAFDFEFTSAEEQLASLAPEIERTLKPGGFFVLHTNSTRDSYSFKSLLELFDRFSVISASEIDGLDSTLREIVMKKERTRQSSPPEKACSASEIASRPEALIERSALKKPWREFSDKNKNMAAIKYLPSMVDISFKRRYVYVDVGAKSYESSIGGWFSDQYPKQGNEFEIFAIESDRSFHGSYLARKKAVELLPMAAWIRNETLFFEIARSVTTKKRRKKVLGRFQAVVPTASHVVESAEVKGFDFAEWLGRSATRRDFIAVKMDVGGAEFHLIPKLVETGAICLIDEFFLACHYDRRKRRVRYRRTYSDCLRLFRLVREKGVLVHQWW